jgi:beta-phosphoglucomutase-like phosphatase (HAD superfamily)
MAVRYRAVVFDLDGVLWDGEPLYHEAFNVVLRPLGHTVSQEDYTTSSGIPWRQRGTG